MAGLVTYQLPFADERHQRIYLERQLLPAYALRPRKYGSYRQWESRRAIDGELSGLDLFARLMPPP